MKLDMKNTLIGAAIGAVVVAGGFMAFSGGSEDNSSNSSPYTRTDNPLETRAFVSVGEEDKDCKDFRTQREAQSFFEANGGPSSDPHNLDRDGDGRVCETLP